MADKWHTFRTGDYRLPYPYVGEPSKLGNISKDSEDAYLRKLAEDTRSNGAVRKVAESVASQLGVEDVVRNAFGDPFKSRDEKRQALLKTYPRLESLLKSVARARASMYNSDEKWAKDKDFGWGHKVAYSKLPDKSEYFELHSDPDNPYSLWVEDLEPALGLKMEDEAKYNALRKAFEDYASQPYTQELVPMKKADAEKYESENGFIDWYPSTNALLDALIAKYGGENNRQAMYDAAQVAFANLQTEDMAKDTPEFQKAWERLADENGKIPRQFEAPSAVPQVLLNMALPFTSSILYDPELYHKTTPLGLVARGVADAGLAATSVGLPWLGATRGAMLGARLGASALPKVVSGMTPMLGSVAGGALGGASQYGLKRLANTGFDEATGKGGYNTPLDATDLAFETLSGALSGPLSSANRLRGLRDLRAKMLPADPASVSPRDVTRSLALTEKYKTKTKAKPHFVSETFRTYEKEYPFSTAKVQRPPVARIKWNNDDQIPGLPDKYWVGLETNQPNGRSIGKAGKLKNSNKNVVRIPTEDGDPMEMVTTFRAGDDKAFYEPYIAQNTGTNAHPGYFHPSFTEQVKFDKSDVGSALRQSQYEGDRDYQFFTGRPVFMNDKELAREMAIARGKKQGMEGNNADAFKYFIYKTHSTRGNKVPGQSWTPADARQTKLAEKANKKYSRRSDMQMVDKTDLRKQSKNSIGTALLKGLSGMENLGTNVIPWSNRLFGVPSYTYETED